MTKSIARPFVHNLIQVLPAGTFKKLLLGNKKIRFVTYNPKHESNRITHYSNSCDHKSIQEDTFITLVKYAANSFKNGHDVIYSQQKIYLLNSSTSVGRPTNCTIDQIDFKL